MCGWKQGDMILAEQERRDYFDFIYDVGIRGIYLSLDYWYCQIQTTRLLIFFTRCFATNKSKLCTLAIYI